MQIPFTLRLAFHGLRAGVRAAVIFFGAWIFLVPATADDVAALGAERGTQYPPGLRIMRSAKVIVAVAPPHAYDLIASASEQDISPWMVRLALTQMAAGYVRPPESWQNDTPPVTSDRDLDGPRFIKVN